MSFSDFLTQRLRELDARQVDISKALIGRGVAASQRAVSGWCLGERIPRPETMPHLLDVLGIHGAKARLAAYELAASSNTDSGAVLTASEAT